MAEELIEKCQVALNDPNAGKDRLRQLIAECADRVKALVAERRALRRSVRAQIEEIAELMGSEEAVWPEEVSRLRALRREIQKRAAAFRED